MSCDARGATLAPRGRSSAAFCLELAHFALSKTRDRVPHCSLPASRLARDTLNDLPKRVRRRLIDGGSAVGRQFIEGLEPCAFA